MSFKDTIRHDYLTVDENEVVTLRVLLADGSYADYEDLTATRDEDPEREMDRSAALLRQATCTWHLWAATMDEEEVIVAPPAPSPKVGDLIREADGTQWGIERVGRREAGNRHTCECRRLLTATR